MKSILCFAVGIFLITLTYYLNLISLDLAHSVKSSGPSEYVAFFIYCIAAIFIIYGFISRDKK